MPPGPIRTALFWGEEPFLLRLAAAELLSGRGFQPTELDGRDWQGGETSDLATPSLWGEPRALLVTGCEDLPETGQRELRAYLEAPSPEALCVLTWSTRGRNPPPLAKAVQAGHGLVRQVVVKRQDLPKWTVERARARGAVLTGPGAVLLVGTVGEDPATLDQSVEQLATAFAGRPIGPQEVGMQFRGLGEQRVWDLCDAALSGDAAGALLALRSLLEAREDPLLILGGIAARIRELIRVASLPGRLSMAETAKAAGLRFEWQARRSRQQAARHGPAALTALHALTADSDRAIKGGTSPEVVLQALVLAMAGETEAALRLPARLSR